METYKMGNKVKAIIRAWCAGKIGDYTLQYKNEPYLILDNVELQLYYRNRQAESRDGISSVIAYNADSISEVHINHIPISDKILNLIYSKNEEKLCNVVENHQSDEENKVYLNSPQSNVYQVFIFSNGEMVQAYGTYDVSEGLTVPQPDTNYTICYSYEGDVSVNLNRPENYYVILDFEITGNINDQTAPMWIHIEKCCPVYSKQFNFNSDINTVDLRFRVIEDGTTNNYITFK
jgi:hypothetical protein